MEPFDPENADLEPRIEIHSHRRLREAGGHPPRHSHEISTRRMKQHIEQVHRRLLERATGGRLTWSGNRIIRTADAARHLPPRSISAVEDAAHAWDTGSHHTGTSRDALP